MKGQHEANAELQWCWKTKPDDTEAPCDAGATAIFSKSFDVKITSGLWDTSVSHIAEAKSVLEVLSLVFGPATLGTLLGLVVTPLWKKLLGRKPENGKAPS
ncbi:MAG: hypothetical protein A2Y74_08240 [Actinobacteria bacterium RBG_13_63_9]|nr:MAG: hypothetical protein A2Y74_08240 [Actinobacteria bacterium RBG_13_63_9]